MQHAFGRAVVAAAISILILDAGARPSAAGPVPREPAGLDVSSCLGPGAAALGDESAALFAYPGALSLADRPQAFLQQGTAVHLGTLRRFALVLPPASGLTFGLGYAHRHLEPAATNLGAERHDWRLGLAGAVWRGIALGGAVRLGSRTAGDVLETSYGADLGLHLRPGLIGHTDPAAASRWTRLALGLTLRNVLRPDVRPAADTRREARQLEAAAAYSLAPRSDWQADLSMGVVTRESGPKATWLGMRLRWRQALEMAAGRSRDELRLGVGARLGSVRLDYSRTQTPEGGLQALALGVGLGSSRESRRATRTRAEEERLAARLGRDLAARDSLQAEHCREEAERTAASLQCARLVALLQDADTLAARGEPAGAVLVLERALDLFPDDGEVAVRLDSLRLAARRVAERHDAADEQFRRGIDAFAERRYADAAQSFRTVLDLEASHRGAVYCLRRAEEAVEAELQAGRRAHDLQTLEHERQERRLAESRRAQATLAAEDHAPPAGPPPAAVAAGYARGVQLYRAGDLIGAMRAWEDVALGAPHYREVDQYLLRVYRVCGLESYTEGRLQDAIDTWSKALRLEPGNEQVRRYLNQAHAKLLRTQPAAERGR